MASTATLSDLMQVFQTKIDLVKDSLLLKNGLSDPDCKEMLSTLRCSVQELQVAVTLLHTEIKQQKQALDKLKVRSDADPDFFHLRMSFTEFMCFSSL